MAMVSVKSYQCPASLVLQRSQSGRMSVPTVITVIVETFGPVQAGIFRVQLESAGFSLAGEDGRPHGDGKICQVPFTADSAGDVTVTMRGIVLADSNVKAGTCYVEVSLTASDPSDPTYNSTRSHTTMLSVPL